MGDNRNRFGLTEAEKKFIKGRRVTESEDQKKETRRNKTDSRGSDQSIYSVIANSQLVSSRLSLLSQSATMDLSTPIKLYSTNA